MKILVLDDDQTQLDVCVELFELHGHEVLTVLASHETTMDHIFSLIEEEAVEVVITDNDMPAFQGIELLGALCDHFFQLRLVLCSGGMCPDLANMVAACDGAVPLAKPVSCRALLNSLEGVFEPIN